MEAGRLRCDVIYFIGKRYRQLGAQMAKKRNENELTKIDDALDRDQYALAEELCHRYVVKYPDDIEGQLMNGLTQYFLGSNKAAETLLRAVLPQLCDDLRGVALAYLARISRDAGDFAEAEQFYRQAIDDEPQDGGNYVELGSMLLSSNRIQEAEAVAKKGIEADAGPIADLYRFMGICHRSQGEIVKTYQSNPERAD